MGIWAGIKYALNSTLGTSGFKPLDQLIEESRNSKTKTINLTYNPNTSSTKTIYTGRGRIKSLVIYSSSGNYGDIRAGLNVDEDLISQTQYTLSLNPTSCIVLGYNLKEISGEKIPLTFITYNIDETNGNPLSELSICFSKNFSVSLKRYTGQLPSRLSVYAVIDEY